MDWSFQLYSARNFQPWSKVLATLSDASATRRSRASAASMTIPAGLRAELDKTRPLDADRPFLPRHAARMTSHGAPQDRRHAGHRSSSSCPHIAADRARSDAAGWRAFGERLGKVASASQTAGYDFAWHNHDFEFARLARRQRAGTAYPGRGADLGWEIDVAWVIRGGADPLAWIDSYGDRIVAVHVKDIAPAGESGRRGRLGRCRPRHGRLGRPDQGPQVEDQGPLLRRGARQSEGFRALRQAFDRSCQALLGEAKTWQGNWGSASSAAAISRRPI